MNPPYAFDGSRGGGGMAYMAMVKQEIAHRGWLKHGKQASNKARQLIKQGLHVLVKEAVVPKEAETSKEAGRST